MALGTLDWGRRTAGKLSPSERRALLRPIIRTTLTYAVGRIRLALGVQGAPGGALNLESFDFPDSRLAQEAEAACHETLSTEIVNHSYRTFLFGLALAQLDAVDIDVEHFYVASLLHDIALESPTPDCCFAIAGAEAARSVVLRAGADETTAEAIADAVAMHITPGVGYEHGPLAPTIASGALLDLTGMRLWHLDSNFIDAVIAKYPRTQFTEHILRCWKQETETFTTGRVAAVERYARFSLIIRFSPLADGPGQV